VAVALCLGLVVVSATQIRSGPLFAADRTVRAWVYAHQAPRLFAAFDVVTRIAHWQWVYLALVVVGGALAYKRRHLRPLTQALVSVVLVSLVTWGLKAAFHRPGPTGVRPPPYDGAWPSGHATALVVATVVLLRLLPVAQAPGRARAVVAFVPAALVSAALVYCGDHWFTDVAVAFPLGLLLGWAALAVEQLSRQGEAPRPSPGAPETAAGRWRVPRSERARPRSAGRRHREQAG
jgi:undecaprenyl-diphosphatase